MFKLFNLVRTAGRCGKARWEACRICRHEVRTVQEELVEERIVKFEGVQIVRRSP